jgi:hypothetical protein
MPPPGDLMRITYAFVVLTFLATLGQAQTQQAIIVCEGRAGIPAWEKPGSMLEIKHLSCDQTVMVLGSERDFVKIQINENLVGYVAAKYIKTVDSQSVKDLRTTEQEGRTNSNPEKVRSGETTVPERPQRQVVDDHSPESSETPAVEIFGGYSFLNADINGYKNSRQISNGWETSISVNFDSHAAIELDMSGYYKKYYGYLTVSNHAFLAGPRLNYGPVYGHALIGGDSLSEHMSGFSATEMALAMALGAGIQVPINSLLSFRGGVDYAPSWHSRSDGSAATQFNFRFSAGIVFKFGRR